jgi:peroxiredoxin
VSTDSEEQQTAFSAKHELPFLLLSDERRTAVGLLRIETVAEGENVNVRRPVAIAVDRDGIIRDVVDPVDPEALVERAMRALSEPLPAAGDASAAG